ncbi:MAG: hypothetical protein LWY06_17995 [Firmicutes bacterium]|nr:hypothetical protein [Bacillota bacterium]
MKRFICVLFAALFLIFASSGCEEANNASKAAELQKQIITLEAELQLRQQENKIIKDKYDLVMGEVKKIEKNIKDIGDNIPTIEKLENEIKDLEKAVAEEKAKSGKQN